MNKMLEIKNTRVYGLEESMVAGGYPMELDIPSTEDFEDRVDAIKGEINSPYQSEYGEGKVRTSKKLGNVPSGTGHDNFLKGVIVQMDVNYPQYWTPQFQRYTFHDIVSSNSKMHRITKMDIEKCCNKYVDFAIIKRLNKYVEIYNNFPKDMKVAIVRIDGSYCYLSDAPKKVNEGSDVYNKYEMYMKVISNAPLGLMQFMRVTTNYLQLKTIYQQRNSHKLKEDWQEMCRWMETLPMFVELCLKGKRKFT